MFRQSLAICISMACANLLAVAQDTPASRVKLSAVDIADKNVAVRGGLQAWRAVQTMSLAGKLGAGGNQRAALPVPNPGPGGAGRRSSRQTLASRPAEEVQLPFVMELQRPRKMRFELQFNGQTAIQGFDGSGGWMAPTIRWKSTSVIIGRSTACRFRSFWRQKSSRWPKRRWGSRTPPFRQRKQSSIRSW